MSQALAGSNLEASYSNLICVCMILTKWITASEDKNGVKHHYSLHHCIQAAKEAMICQGIKSTYLISSNSPSGGIKLIARSVSNLLSLTHCKQTRKGLKRFSPLPPRKYRYKRQIIISKIN